MAFTPFATPTTPPLKFSHFDHHQSPFPLPPNPSSPPIKPPSRASTTPASAGDGGAASTTSGAATPSLSDQLRPLTLTLLKSRDPHHPLPPKPTWINPSKPKPNILNPQRHKRPPFSHNPDLKTLTHLAGTLAAAPEAGGAALSAALAPHLPISRQNALLLLNSLRSHPTKSLALLSFLKTQFSPLDTIFYNVALKSLRRSYDLAESLAREMIADAIPLDNVTYSTIITSAKRSRRFDRAIEWFERMYKTGVIPDEVTYSAVLDVYAKLGKKEEVMGLYERARAGGWKPDPIAFSVLAKMFGEAGDYDGIRYVLQEMKGLGVRPNVIVYNTLLEAMGRAGRPGLARSLFEEMVADGLVPNERTLTALIRVYGKARWSRDAMELWDRMRAKKWPMDFILYNTLLSMCADLGLEGDAEKLFDDMKTSEERGGRRPDSWSYTAMINIYASGGKPERAMEMFEEMLANGVEPNVMGITCLIQCLGKARRMEDAARVFEIAMEKGIAADDRLCGCLLSVTALCEKGEMSVMLACLEKANHRLSGFVRMIEKEETGFDEIKEELKEILNEAAVDARRPFCNCLIDLCRNRGFPSQRAHELFYLGTLYGLYPGLHSRNSKEWSLNLRSLSVGAANTAFEEWMKTIASSIDCGEGLPLEFYVHTGAGTHKFSQGLASAVSSHLKELAAPFEPSEEKSGSFLALKDNLVAWVLHTRVMSPALAA